MKRGILIFLAWSAALAMAWPNGAKESAPKPERVRAPRQSAPLVYSYQQDKPVYTVKVPPPAPSAPVPAAQISPASPAASNPKPLEPVARVKQIDFKESNPTFASYGCATMAVLGTVQTMTGTQFSKTEVEEIIAKNKANEGFNSEQYAVIWVKTVSTALNESGTKAECVGLLKLDNSGNEVYKDFPKSMEGVVCPITGPVKGLSSSHFVEGNLPSGSKTIYNPGNTDVSLEKKEVFIPLIKVEEQKSWSWTINQ
jgi:hypothetical protein